MHGLFQGLGLDPDGLLGQLCLTLLLAGLGQLMIDALALEILLAQTLIPLLQLLAGRAQLLVDNHALVQMQPQLFLELGQWPVSFGQLLLQLHTATFQL